MATTDIFCLTNKCANGVLLETLPAFHLDDDTLSDDLTASGWRYAQFDLTGARVLVRWKRNRRWLAGWSDFVTDFEVRHVDTIANSDGVILAALGEPHHLRLYALAKYVERAL
jgi:hypothetical protein